jgi:hypothetical protein
MRRTLTALVLACGMGLAGCGRSPAAVPEPTPTPAPSAQGEAARLACQLPRMPDHGNCRYQAFVFWEPMEKALDEVIALHPEVFDMERVRGCDKCFYIVDGHAFYRHLIERLERQGLCAQCDEECGIKNTNAFNEQWDMIVADGYVRWGVGSYRATCYPAAF